MRATALGSVSNPITDDLQASFVIIHADRAGHNVEHRRVSYGHDAFLATVAIRASGSRLHRVVWRGEQIRYSSERAGAPTRYRD